MKPILAILISFFSFSGYSQNDSIVPDYIKPYLEDFHKVPPALDSIYDITRFYEIVEVDTNLANKFEQVYKDTAHYPDEDYTSFRTFEWKKVGVECSGLSLGCISNNDTLKYFENSIIIFNNPYPNLLLHSDCDYRVPDYSKPGPSGPYPCFALGEILNLDYWGRLELYPVYHSDSLDITLSNNSWEKRYEFYTNGKLIDEYRVELTEEERKSLKYDDYLIEFDSINKNQDSTFMMTNQFYKAFNKELKNGQKIILDYHFSKDQSDQDVIECTNELIQYFVNSLGVPEEQFVINFKNYIPYKYFKGVRAIELIMLD